MHPELEDFLEAAFSTVPPVSAQIGRAVIEPDYEIEPNLADACRVAEEFNECVRRQELSGGDLTSRAGLEVKLLENCPVLRKYVRRITLHSDRVEGSWIEVAEPGFWI